MAKIIIQIYEIQEPSEAEKLIRAGVDHIGSVILSEENWKVPLIRETIDLISMNSAQSSLIPLFSDIDTISRAIDYYRPNIIHFCEDLVGSFYDLDISRKFVYLQQMVKEQFPEIKIIRSIPIPAPGAEENIPVLKLARMFEPFSDYFLTDTLLLANEVGALDKKQPVTGFVGITGKICDWNIASKLVQESRIPVILAGGISPSNVTEGISRVLPAGVDSCTCTNALDSKGRPIRFKKDMAKVNQLVKAVRACESSK